MVYMLAQAVPAAQAGTVDRILDEVFSKGRFEVLAWGVFIVLLVLISKINTTIRMNARERTRREIAAYVAEGSITPEHGERLMKAGRGTTSQ